MASANDDYSGDTSTTGTIAIGGTSQGVTEVPYDVDWFKTPLVAGITYQFALTSAGGSPNMQMYTGNGNYIPVQSVAGGQSPVIWFKPTVSGSYYLDVAGGNTIGSYSIKASALATDDYTDVAARATTLALGAKSAGISNCRAIATFSRWRSMPVQLTR